MNICAIDWNRVWKDSKFQDFDAGAVEDYC